MNCRDLQVKLKEKFPQHDTVAEQWDSGLITIQIYHAGTKDKVHENMVFLFQRHIPFLLKCMTELLTKISTEAQHETN